MSDTADVIVAGAGIIGLSTAYQIARRSALRVTVLEKAAGVGHGSTGASSAILRHRYSLDETVRLARDGIECYRRWPDFTGLPAPRAAFENVGVLWLADAQGDWLEADQRRLDALGIEARILSGADVTAAFPALSPCPLAPDLETGAEHACGASGRALFEPTGGYIDPVAAAEDLLAAARREGVDVRFATPATALRQAGGRVTGVELGSGGRIDAPVVVNACGPWYEALIASSGIRFRWPLVPTRIQVLYVDLPTPWELPVCADIPGGIYFRPQNRFQQLVVGSVLEADEQEAVADADAFEREADPDFRAAKLHALHHRLPGLPYRGAVRSYCGLYTVNRRDAHPLVGPTELDGFLLANGFSGHGFKLAPAIGALLARHVTGAQAELDTGVDIAFLDPRRTPLDVAVGVLA